MKTSARLMATLAASTVAVAISAPALATPIGDTAPPSLVARPLVIAHRGASGYRPEHTVAAYELAVRQGADVIEPDLVSTKDHVLVVLHDLELSSVTDVASHPELADRRRTKTVNGTSVTGWFVDDLTLLEVKTLRVHERTPDLRPGNARYDGQYQVPTFAEVLDLRARLSASTGRAIAVYPELKTPGYFRAEGLALEPVLVQQLRDAGLDGATAPAMVQSFEAASLQRLHDVDRLRTRLALLTTGGAAYASLLTADGLRGVARWASIVAPAESQVLPRRSDGRLGSPTTLVSRIHAAGLQVHVWAMRSENAFLPVDYRVGSDPATAGRSRDFDQMMLRAGVDGLFCDQPDICVAAGDAYRPKRVHRTWTRPRR